MSTISAETGLIYTMVIAAASDMQVTDSEFKLIEGCIDTLPALSDYVRERLVSDADNCLSLLDSEEGIEAVLGLIAEAVPETHYDLVYLVACETAAADGVLSQEELRLLEIFRHSLNVDRLTAAAIERGVAARCRRF